MWYVAGLAIVERNYGLVFSLFFFTTLACIAVGLRIFTRTVLVRNVGPDDYFITVAMFGTIGFITAVMYQIRYGLGYQIDPALIQNFLQSLLATITAYNITHLSVKFSVLLQCRRIFTERSAQRLFGGLIIWLTVYGLFCLIATIVTCVPVAKYWDDSIPGSCMNRQNLHFALAGFNIVNDITLLVAPLPYLKNLQIPRRAKIVLMAVFACGGFACIVAVIRLHSLYVSNLAPPDQQPLAGVDIALWSGLEINVAIVCASVPAIKPLFVMFFPKVISSLGDSAKRSRPVHGSVPLRSFGNRGDGAQHGGNGEAKNSPIEIQVHQSFEMKAVAVDGDDNSERNLVTCHGSAWSTERDNGSGNTSHTRLAQT